MICVEDLTNLNEDFQVNFDEDTLKHFKAIGKRIELISLFKKNTLELANKYEHMVDTTKDVCFAASRMNYEPYTTRHYVSACIIYRYWRVYKEKLPIPKL